MHFQLHGLMSVKDHGPGTKPAPGKFNVFGTNDSGTNGTIGELTVEAQDQLTVVAGEIPRRGTGGHVIGPTARATGQQYVTADQAQEIATGGPWRGTVVGDYPDHTSPSVEGLQVGDKVINTTDNMIYEVESIVGGNTGNLATWSAGELPDTNVIYLNILKQAEFYYDYAKDEWMNLGSSGHPRKHEIDSADDHFTKSNRTGVVYTYAETVHVLLTVEESSGTVTALPGSPLLSSASGEPVWGQLRIAPNKINAAGADPAYTDLGPLQNQTLAIVETASSIFLGYKRNSSTSGFVEMTP